MKSYLVNSFQINKQQLRRINYVSDTDGVTVLLLILKSKGASLIHFSDILVVWIFYRSMQSASLKSRVHFEIYLTA